ncbi:MAG: LysR family transcriptional regulator [Ruminococcus sp.]|nr:LysR family transcriptional regulator [Ruminococcus sp.]
MYNHQLDAFIRVADCGSFSKAAEEMYISSPALIKQINQLEDNLGFTLFERNHRGIKLNAAGKSLYRDAKYIIQYSKDSVARAAKAADSLESVIRIGTSIMTPPQFILNLWSEIYKRQPDLKFQLVSFENSPENAREILTHLGRNIDIVAGIYDNNMLETNKCAAFDLKRVPIRCAVSLTHRLAKNDKLTFKDLHGETLMLTRRHWNETVDRLREDIEANHPDINIDDFYSFTVDVFNRCENGSNVLMAIDEWTNVHPLMKIIPVEWDYEMTYGIMHSPEPSEQVQRLIDTLKEIL